MRSEYREAERFERLTFTEETFYDCDFSDCTFIDCTFESCKLDHSVFYRVPVCPLYHHRTKNNHVTRKIHRF